MRLWRIHWRGCAALRKGALGALRHQRPSANAKHSIDALNDTSRGPICKQAAADACDRATLV